MAGASPRILRRAALLAALTGLCTVLDVVDVSAQCVYQFVCANNSIQKAMRLVFPIGANWYVEPPPGDAQLHSSLPAGSVAPLFQEAIDGWVNYSADALPHDMTAAQGFGSFNVNWVDRRFLLGLAKSDASPDGERLAAAPSNLGGDNTTMECSYITGDLFISKNPHDPENTFNKYYWADCPSENCLPQNPPNPACGFACVLDFPSMLAHEYGHLLGLEGLPGIVWLNSGLPPC